MDVSRHLKNVHKKKKEEIPTMVARKTYKFKVETKTKSKNYHVARKCPVSGCIRVVKNLPEHLTKFHRMEKDGAYYALLKGKKGTNIFYI